VSRRYYRFFFMSHGRTIAAEVLECDGDAAALEKAQQLISNSNFNAMEVWQEDRRVGDVERGRP
jgi:hypothetical protein